MSICKCSRAIETQSLYDISFPYGYTRACIEIVGRSRRRSKEILLLVEKYGTQEWADIFRKVYPYASEIRQLRAQFGWRLGRLAFYLKHPKLTYSNGSLMRTAMNMY